MPLVVWRRFRGLTQVELARRAGLSQVALKQAAAIARKRPGARSAQPLMPRCGPWRTRRMRCRGVLVILVCKTVG